MSTYTKTYLPAGCENEYTENEIFIEEYTFSDLYRTIKNEKKQWMN
jgi:hypothetical protein